MRPTRGSAGRSFSRPRIVDRRIPDSGYFFVRNFSSSFWVRVERASRPTLCADRTRAHVAARDHARGTRARRPDSFGLGGGGVARCTAPGTARPPSAAATDTAVPKRRLFPDVPCQIRFARLTRPPLPVPVPDHRRSNGVNPPDMSNGSAPRGPLSGASRAKIAGLLASLACRMRRTTSHGGDGSREILFDAQPPRLDPANAR